VLRRSVTGRHRGKFTACGVRPGVHAYTGVWLVAGRAAQAVKSARLPSRERRNTDVTSPKISGPSSAVRMKNRGKSNHAVTITLTQSRCHAVTLSRLTPASLSFSLSILGIRKGL